MTVNRREIFAALMAAAAARGLVGAEDDVTVAGKRPLILQNDWPEDLETPVSDFDSWLTPTDVFFVRQHLPRPAPIDPAAYRLAVNGLVSKPLSLALADLQKLPQQTIPATLECAGNGRAFFRPQVPASSGAGEPSVMPSGPGPALATCWHSRARTARPRSWKLTVRISRSGALPISSAPCR